MTWAEACEAVVEGKHVRLPRISGGKYLALFGRAEDDMTLYLCCPDHGNMWTAHICKDYLTATDWEVVE